MTDQQLDCALDLMRRLPPQKCTRHLKDLISLVPNLTDDLLSCVDQPLEILKDRQTGKEYLICDYNREQDSYRSPWTNQFDPPVDDGRLPSERLRNLEIEANSAFECYRDAYFEGGVSSCYFWDIENYGFAGIVLIKKKGDGTKNVNGCWDSIHVLEIIEKGRQAHYKLTSTVMLWLETKKEGSGMVNLGGSMTRQTSQDCPHTATANDATPHVPNFGRMIEEQESKMRMMLNEVYFDKTKKVMHDLRTLQKSGDLKNLELLQKELETSIAGRGTNQGSSS